MAKRKTLTKEGKKPKNNAGRDAFKLTVEQLKQVEDMAGMICTWQEIATILGVNKITLEHYEPAKEAHALGVANGMRSVRKAQFDCGTKDGNASMLIWLGKIHLGQKEVQDIKTDDDGAAHVSIGALQ